MFIRQNPLQMRQPQHQGIKPGDHGRKNQNIDKTLAALGHGVAVVAQVKVPNQAQDSGDKKQQPEQRTSP
ncbi:hypothetical protein [Aliiglaciecola sp. CAU 1673]|uniref:hypothetical protein n=1 Tax=Aliiglaciecola sp. CAU 1673 TaxID=3032595 RepID=UPI0023DB9E7A|nr:hypothetical protein [Aliiglaciecola sp. CAU 1673]